MHIPSILQEYVLKTRVICDETAWDAIRRDWEALYDVSPYASVPLKFDWLREWWRIYGPVYGVGGLRIVTVWRSLQLIGVLPLFMAKESGWADLRVLRFISTGEAEHEEICPDYLNMLCRPGDESLCLREVWNVVSQMRWDALELIDIPADSPLISWSRSIPGAPCSEIIQRGACPVADLSRGFEAYLGQLSAKTRQHSRQYIRTADKSGATLDLASGSEADVAYKELVRLHQDRWTADGKPGCFAAPRFIKFHHQLVNLWLPKGCAVLARLVHSGQTYAVMYGFIHGGKFDFYQSGVKNTDQGPFVSPGTTANLLLMRVLSGKGIVAYDFLRGSASSYKERLATRTIPLVGFRMWRPGIRMAFHQFGLFAVQSGHKLLSVARRSVNI